MTGFGTVPRVDAATTQSHVITQLAETAVTPPSPAFAMAIDTVNQRGYLANIVDKSIQVFDLSGGTLAQIATIRTGLVAPTFAVMDQANRRLFVGETSASRVSVIDADPSSATNNTVTSSFAVSDRPEWLGVDEAGQRIIVSGQIKDFFQVFDLAKGTSMSIPAKVGLKRIAVDQSTGTAFITAGDASGVVTVERDGSHAEHVVTGGVTQVEFASNKLITVGTSISVIDTSDWSTEATYPFPYDAWSSVAIDEVLGTMYFIPQFAGSPIEVLSFPNLRKEGRLPVADTITGISVDPSTHRIVTAGSRLTMYSVELRPKPVVERVTGADRYEVSAAVASGLRPMAPVVYVASGTGFADALSASAVAGAEGGPVLLVRKDSIPDAVEKQLDRLDPQRIVVMGGTASVSADVERQLGAYSGTIERRSGADRYAVSAAASESTFGPSRPIAYIASGEVFSDALSGSAAAGRLGGPVLLAKKDSVPGAIAAELSRLAPAKVVILGGTNTLTEAVITDVKKASPGSTITRTGGADRYAVSATVANEAFPEETPIAYVASGALFPDALSGSAAAIANGAPVLLVTRTTVPAAIDSALDRLRPERIVVLGGESSIAPEVLTALRDH
jgi:putative cell wall-binding protein